MVVPELATRRGGARIRRKVDESRTAKPLGGGGGVGDLADEVSVRIAMEDVDRVFLYRPGILATRGRCWGCDCRAAKDAGVRRFIFSSVIIRS